MQSRIDKFREVLAKHGLDSFLILHGPNRNYLSGFTGSSGALILGPKSGHFLTDSRYTVQAASQVKGLEIVLQTKALLADAAALVRRLGIRRLGFEAAHLSQAAWESLRQALPKVDLKPCVGLVESLRAIKDEGEKARMRRAARITDQAFHYILGRMRPGRRERDLAAELEHFMRLRGASGPSFDTIVASGWRSALPHGVASDKRLERGDMVVLDFGCVVDGYCSDRTRTVCLGRPTPLQRRVYALVRRAQEAGLARLRAGRSGRQVDEAARGVIRRAGFGRRFGHGLGHGVGVEVHEEPRLSPAANEILKPGHAVTVEPGIYLEGRFGVRIEDLAFVTEDGHENLYRSSKELISL